MDDEKVRPSEGKKSGEPSKILAEPLPRILEEMDENVKRAAKAAIEAAVKEAKTEMEKIAGQAREAAETAAAAASKAEEAFTKASEALPAELLKSIIRSRQFLGIIILFFLGSVFASVCIGFGLSLLSG